MSYFNRPTKNKNITLDNLYLDNLSKDEIDFIQTLNFNEYFNKLEDHLEENYDSLDIVELIEDNGVIYLSSTDLDGGKDIPSINTDLSYNIKEKGSLNTISLFSVYKYERVDKTKKAIVVYTNSTLAEVGIIN